MNEVLLDMDDMLLVVVLYNVVLLMVNMNVLLSSEDELNNLLLSNDFSLEN